MSYILSTYEKLYCLVWVLLFVVFMAYVFFWVIYLADSKFERGVNETYEKVKKALNFLFLFLILLSILLPNPVLFY